MVDLVYTCYYHPNLPAVMVCGRCGRNICSSCSKPYLDLALCPQCFHSTVPRPMAPAATTAAVAPPVPPAGVAPGGVIYGPFPRPPYSFFRSRWIAVALILISAGLIMANAVALLSPTFWAAWVGFVPWVAFLGDFAFILGIVLGLVLVVAVIMLLFGFRVLAAFVIFPTAIVSLFIGGGFIAGLILGVLAGLLLIVNGAYWHP